MKSYNILTLIFLVFYQMINAQTEVDKILLLQYEPRFKDEYYVQTTFNKLNNSAKYFQDFLDFELKLCQTGETVYKLNKGVGTITSTYTDCIIHGFGNIDEEAYKIFIQYTVFPIENDLFAEKLDVWGNLEKILKIFINYCPTGINFEHMTNNQSEITSYFLNDRIVFSTEIRNGKQIGRIRVRSTTGDDYKKFIKDYELKKQNYIDNKQIVAQDSLKRDEEKKQIEIRKEIELKKVEQEKLDAFLIQRKNTIFSLAKYNLSSYNKTLNELESQIHNFLLSSNLDQFYIRGELKLQVDTNFIKTINSDFVNTDHQAYLNQLTNILIEATAIEPVSLNGYYVNTEMPFFMNISYRSATTTFKIDNARQFVFHDLQLSENLKMEIEKAYRNSARGKYTVKYEIFRNEKKPTVYKFELVEVKKQMHIPVFIFGIFTLILIGAFSL